MVVEIVASKFLVVFLLSQHVIDDDQEGMSQRNRRLLFSGAEERRRRLRWDIPSWSSSITCWLRRKTTRNLEATISTTMTGKQSRSGERAAWKSSGMK